MRPPSSTAAAATPGDFLFFFTGIFRPPRRAGRRAGEGGRYPLRTPQGWLPLPIDSSKRRSRAASPPPNGGALPPLAPRSPARPSQRKAAGAPRLQALRRITPARERRRHRTAASHTLLQAEVQHDPDADRPSPEVTRLREGRRGRGSRRGVAPLCVAPLCLAWLVCEGASNEGVGRYRLVDRL